MPVPWSGIYEVVSPDEFVETFELANGVKPYEVYSKARFKRAGPKRR